MLLGLTRNTFLMKRLVFVAVVGFVLCVAMPGVCNAQAEKKPVTFTEKDRAAGLKQLTDTQANFAKALKGLSKAQLNFKPNEKSWSVGQTAEHIMLAEGLITEEFIKKGMKAPLNKNQDVFRVNDVAVTLAITNRLQKFNAPPVIQPKKESKSISDLVSGFNMGRDANIALLKNAKADLRNHFIGNPLIGTIDAYQTFLFLNGHTERHLAQIAEIKANKNFPKN